ncbi:WXG100 family type VII secretion target [Streptacidiphilus rugosus]|uniref:WXG100 family type VII secretion target n=1 Tax=Streptacidiphilus rugosus TaxID=405783 RepID=UPI000565C0C8|nr:PPE domain-containing protein [Streptacidiphilus rugosus]
MSDVFEQAEAAVEGLGAVGTVLSDVVGAVLHAVNEQNLADRLWSEVLRANRGGHHGGGGFTTDFEAAPDVAALRAMIETADPAAVQTVAEHWRHLHDELGETAARLTLHAGNLLEHWAGPSADAFRRRTATLHESLTNGAAHAANAAAATGGVAQALSVARARMPEDPSLLDTVLRAVTSQSTDWQFKKDAAAHGLARALDADGAQLSAPEQARQQAVVVMEQLGVAYNNATAQLNNPPHPPTAAHRAGAAWPPPPAPAHASLLGSGRLRTAAGGLGSPALGAGQGPGAAPAPAATRWPGARPPEVSPTATASEPARTATAAGAEPEPGAVSGRAGEPPRPSGTPGRSGRGSRRRTRYPHAADPDAWETQPRANPPVIEA